MKTSALTGLFGPRCLISSKKQDNGIVSPTPDSRRRAHKGSVYNITSWLPICIRDFSSVPSKEHRSYLQTHSPTSETHSIRTQDVVQSMDPNQRAGQSHDSTNHFLRYSLLLNSAVNPRKNRSLLSKNTATEQTQASHSILLNSAVNPGTNSSVLSQNTASQQVQAPHKEIAQDR